MKHNPNGSIQPKLVDIGGRNTGKIWKEVLHSMIAVLTARLNYIGIAYVNARMWMFKMVTVVANRESK